MPIETSTTIANLDALWPLSGDFVLEGDDHLRLLKQVLKAQFPGVNGQGFNTPITATEAEINSLSGLTSSVQDQIDALKTQYQNNLYAPAGTVMIFYQSSPPAGWAQVKNNNDSMLRVVNSAGGSGGSNSPTAFDVPAHAHTTSSVSLSVAQIPPHSHSVSVANRAIYKGSGVYIESGDSYNLDKKTTYTTSNSGSGAAHNHGQTSSKGAVSFRPKYINVMTAVKL